jgi:hypothetical protein
VLIHITSAVEETIVRSIVISRGILFKQMLERATVHPQTKIGKSWPRRRCDTTRTRIESDQ